MEGKQIYLKHYWFDKSVSSIPAKELTIFALNDSNTIRQAIVAYQKQNPDIYINFRIANNNQNVIYTYGVKNPNETLSISDYVEALNTELLAGKGADILILDGLPIESYIEKGVLEDMEDVLLPQIEADVLMKNIAENYVKDGKIYTMPLRFRVPIIYGSSEAVNASKSLEDLARFSEENTEVPLFGKCDYRSLSAWMLLLNYGDVINANGEINEENFERFLQNISKIAHNIQAAGGIKPMVMNSSQGIYVGHWAMLVFEQQLLLR